jgi:hypothetical protein
MRFDVSSNAATTKTVTGEKQADFWSTTAIDFE